jgi:hypothetical protein
MVIKMEIKNAKVYEHIMANIMGQKDKSSKQIQSEVVDYILSLDLPLKEKDHIMAMLMLVMALHSKVKGYDNGCDSVEVKRFIQHHL